MEHYSLLRCSLFGFLVTFDSLVDILQNVGQDIGVLAKQFNGGKNDPAVGVFQAIIKVILTNQDKKVRSGGPTNPLRNP